MRLRSISLVLVVLASTAYTQTSGWFSILKSEQQRAIELKASIRVMFVALEPGLEDLSLIAYARLSLGASVSTLYCTNGEAAEPDQMLFPNQLAAARRFEAYEAMRAIGADAYFLNLPDPGSVSSTESLLAKWPADTVAHRLGRLVSRLRPDVIIVCDIEGERGSRLAIKMLREGVTEAANTIREGAAAKGMAVLNGLQPWNVHSIIAEDVSAKLLAVNVRRRIPHVDRTAVEIGRELQKYYRLLPDHSALEERDRFFKVLYPSLPFKKTFDQTVSKSVSSRLAPLSQEIDNWYSTYVADKNKKERGKSAAPSLKSVAQLLAKVNFSIATWQRLDAGEKGMVLQWKSGLENLRNAILGIDLRFTLSDSIVTNRQLTFLQFDTLIGHPQTGPTLTYFPATLDGWIVDETSRNKFPFRMHEPYRLLSPALLSYNVPAAEYGLEEPTVGKQFNFLILHSDTVHPERSFNYRASAMLYYSPKFTALPLIPIVRITPGEFTVIELTNHSRDGFRDTIEARDSLVSSNHVPFRLPSKESNVLDTLFLSWRKGIADGTYLFPFDVRGERVAQFAGRKFSCGVDSTKSVGYFSGVRNSPLENALRRLGVHAQSLNFDARLGDKLGSLNVVIVDRKVLTIRPNIAEGTKALEDFVARGGHVVILEQDAAAWSKQPLLDGLTLTPTMFLDPLLSVSADSTHRLVTSPNRLAPDDWEDWLYRLGYNTLNVRDPVNIHVVAEVTVGGKKMPLVVTKSSGSGHVTYVELDFGHQWMNVHPGAYRLLANLISF